MKWKVTKWKTKESDANRVIYMINWLSNEMNERSKQNELSLNSDGIEVRPVCTGRRCRTERRRKCISESLISTIALLVIDGDPARPARPHDFKKRGPVRWKRQMEIQKGWAMISRGYLGILTLSAPPAVSYIYTKTNYRKTLSSSSFTCSFSPNHTPKPPTQYVP